MRDLAVLDTYRRESTHPWLTCPVKGHLRLVNRRTGVVATGRCDRLSCPACLPRVVFDVGSAIGLARPEWLVTLTQVGGAWQQVKRRMQRLRQYMKRADLLFETAYHVEHNPGGSGLHAHMWLHGDRPRHRDLNRLAINAGLGEVTLVKPMRYPHNGRPVMLTYGMKECLETFDPRVMPPRTIAFLEVNGGRLVHPSRGFWRDAAGSSLKDRRQAMAEARAARGLTGQWLLLDAV